MKFLSLFLCVFLLNSCLFSNIEEENQAADKRAKQDGTKKRAETIINVNIQPEKTENTDQTDHSSVEKLVFPIQLIQNQQAAFFIKSADHKKIAFSTEGENSPTLNLIAGLSGTVSLETKDGVHYLSLASEQSDLVLHFEMSAEGSLLETSDQAQVKQGQILIKSEKPILYYISSHSEIHVLCLNTSDLEKTVKVVKDLPETTDCL